MSRHRILLAALLWSLASLSCGTHVLVTAPVESERAAGLHGDALSLSPEADPANPGTTLRPGGGDPPIVRITDPVINRFFTPTLPAHATVHWTSADADGPGPGPKAYYYRVIQHDDPDYFTALLFPEQLRESSSPDFPGWTRVRGTVESAVLPDLEPNEAHILVVTAVDRRGNEDPAFSADRNMLVFYVAAPTLLAEGGQESAEERSPRRHS